MPVKCLNDAYEGGRTIRVSAKGAVELESRQVSGNILEIDFATTILTGAIVAVNSDMVTNLTHGDQDVTFISNNIPTGGAGTKAHLDFQSGGTQAFRVEGAGRTFIGNETVNTNMTVGITVQQGGFVAGYQFLAAKSTEVAHGMTGVVETDTFADFFRSGTSQGGVDIRGFTEQTRGVRIIGYGVADTTTKTGDAYVIIGSYKRNGAGPNVTTPGADANILSIQSGGSSIAVFDAEGTLHLDLAGSGTASAPSFSLASDVNSGLFSHDADQLGMTVGGNPLVWGDAAITLAAGDDADGGDIYSKIQDGGPDDAGTGGNDGATYNFIAGDGSDAKAASGQAGGNGGIYQINPGIEGAGDGAGDDGIRGTIEEWSRLDYGGGRHTRALSVQDTGGVLTAQTELTMTLSDNEAWDIEVEAVAIENDGSDRALFNLKSLWYRNGGNATQQGGTTSFMTERSDINWNLDFNGNGNDVEIRINSNNDTVNWKIFVIYKKVATS